MDAKAQFHLRHARPSIRTAGSPAVLAMRGHGPRCSIHHHSRLSGVGREVQLDVVHTDGCDAVPGGLEPCCGDVDADNPAGRRGPLCRFERGSAKAAAHIEHSFAWPQLDGVEHRLTGWGEECFFGVAELLVLPV
jgi:hypothetical protein